MVRDHIESKELIILEVINETLRKQITVRLSNLKHQTCIISYFLWVNHHIMALLRASDSRSLMKMPAVRWCLGL